MSPQTAIFIADGILLLHLLVVLLVVAMPPLVWIGAGRGWRFVLSPLLRGLHLLTIAFVVVQSWLDQYCPLTVWESALRRHAGQAGHQRGLIEDFVGGLLYYQAPPWVFVLIYSAFGALVAWTWWRWPPRSLGGQRGPD